MPPRMTASHLASTAAYAAFYNEQAPERPWTPLEHVPYMHQIMPRWGVVHQQLVMWQHRRVVELGCMDGFNLLNLALTVPTVTCVGVDVNEAAITEARQRAVHFGVADRVRFEVGMVEDVALPAASFDAVLLLEILEHVIDPYNVLAVANKLVADGGRVYLSAPMTEPPHDSADDREALEHVRLLDDFNFQVLLGMHNQDHYGAPCGFPVWYTQLPSPGWVHHCGAYQVTR